MFSPVVFTSFFPHKYVNVKNLSFQLVSLIIACTLPHHSVTRVVSVLFFLLLLTQFFFLSLISPGPSKAKQSTAEFLQALSDRPTIKSLIRPAQTSPCVCYNIYAGKQRNMCYIYGFSPTLSLVLSEKEQSVYSTAQAQKVRCLLCSQHLPILLKEFYA